MGFRPYLAFLSSEPLKRYFSSIPHFLPFVNLSLGCGDLTRFWTDPWVPRPPFEKGSLVSSLSPLLKMVSSLTFVMAHITRTSSFEETFLTLRSQNLRISHPSFTTTILYLPVLIPGFGRLPRQESSRFPPFAALSSSQ